MFGGLLGCDIITTETNLRYKLKGWCYMNTNPQTPGLKEFVKTRKEFFTFTESEDILGIILRGHIIIEGELINLLERTLVKPDIIKLSKKPYSSNLKLAASLGLVDQEWLSPFNKLNEFRNKFAHHQGYEFEDKDYDDLLSTLSKEDKQEFLKDLENANLSENIKKKYGVPSENFEENLKFKIKMLISFLWSYLKLQILLLDSLLKNLYLLKQIDLLSMEKQKIDTVE